MISHVIHHTSMLKLGWSGGIPPSGKLFATSEIATGMGSETQKYNGYNVTNIIALLFANFKCVLQTEWSLLRYMLVIDQTKN